MRSSQAGLKAVEVIRRRKKYGGRGLSAVAGTAVLEKEDSWSVTGLPMSCQAAWIIPATNRGNLQSFIIILGLEAIGVQVVMNDGVPEPRRISAGFGIS